MTKEECIFCKIVAGEIQAQVVHENEQVLAFEDLHPQAPVHILVVPKDHIATVNDLASEHRQLVGELYLAAQKVASDKGVADSGYRTVINCNRDAHQTVFHLHLHVLGGRAMGWPPG